MKFLAVTVLICILVSDTVLCQECGTRGLWGDACEKQCEIHCSRCARMTGTCSSCVSGYWGSYCNSICPENCWSSCDRITGACYSCRNYLFWGDTCNTSCSLERPNCLTCSKSSGSCYTCNLKFWGSDCQQNCGASCQQCDFRSGECKTCLPGVWGKTCTNTCYDTRCEHCRVSDGTCEKCKEGYWGESCGESCDSSNCAYTYCEKNTGHCELCTNNYWGDFCNQTCDIKGCTSKSACSNTTGARCYTCLGPKWGSLCENDCPENCLTSCQTSNGYCSACTDGFWGNVCNQTCYGSNCLSCRKNNGDCQNCMAGFWGDNCEESCYLSHCEVENCFKRNGTCNKCKKNYWGEFCNRSCVIDDCVGLSLCSKTDGPICYYCVNGKWGETCAYNCSANCFNGCKMSNGECIDYQNDATGDANDQIKDNIPYGVIIGINIAATTGVALLFVLSGIVIHRFLQPRIIAGCSRKDVTKPFPSIENEYANNMFADTESNGRNDGLREQSDQHSADVIGPYVIQPDIQMRPLDGAIENQNDYYETVKKTDTEAAIYDPLNTSPYANLMQ